MHEFSLAVNIIEIAEENAKKAQAKYIHSIDLEVGEMSGVVMEALKMAMTSAVKGTMLENTEINYIIVSANAKCSVCRAIFPVHDVFTPCPNCGYMGNILVKGKELKVKSMNIE
ncbi:MAG: hydrogenase maturation nickel metallochaperone HypA [Bacteroidota bacterium]